MPVFRGVRCPQPVLTHLLCQHQDDADRFHRLGLGRERLAVTGSIKFDIQLDEQVQTKGRALRQLLGAERPVWIAASTHQGKTSRCWPPSIGCLRRSRRPC